MNETNRTAIVLLAAIWIALMAIVVFVTWAADTETVERLGDFVQYLDDHRDNASRLILTLGALVLVVLALLVIVVEIAPEEETREIKVEQAGATTIVPAEPLRLRLEEALTALPAITAAKAQVFSHDKGIGMNLDLTVTPSTNVAVVTQEASRVVVETLQADLGLPVSAPPTVRIAFGAEPVGEPVASSVTQPPIPEPPPPLEPSPPPPPPGEPATPPAEPPATPEAAGPPPEIAAEPTAESEGPGRPASDPPAPEAPPSEEDPSQGSTQQH